MLLSLLTLACVPIELAETEVAVHQQWAHVEFTGQFPSVAVIGLRLCDVGWIATRGDLAEEAKGPGLVTTFAVLAGQGEGFVSQRQRGVETTSSQTGGPS